MIIDRPQSSQQKHQQQSDLQNLQASFLALYDEPTVTQESIRIFENCVAVAHEGPFEPSSIDRKAYQDYVASLMIRVQS